MKLRSCLVSNSSSSSYVLYGFEMYAPDAFELLKKTEKGRKVIEKYGEYYDSLMNIGVVDDMDYFYFGSGLYDLLSRKTETGDQLKERVKREAAELFGEEILKQRFEIQDFTLYS